MGRSRYLICGNLTRFQGSIFGVDEQRGVDRTYTQPEVFSLIHNRKPKHLAKSCVATYKAKPELD